MSGWIVRIGSAEVTELLLPESNLHLAEAMKDSFRLLLKFEPDVLASVDLGARLHVLIRQTPNSEPVSVFHGFVVEANIDETTVTLTGEGMALQMKEFRTGGKFGKGLKPEEILYYMVKSVDPDLTDPAYISQFSGKGSLADRVELFRRRTFHYVLPCPAIADIGESLLVGNALIYDWRSSGTFDDDLIAASFRQDELPEEWEHPVRIRMPIDCCGFVEGFQDGFDRSNEVLDAVSLVLNRTALTTQSGFRWNSYDRRVRGLDTRRSRWAYLREVHPNPQRYWTRWFDGHLDSGKKATRGYIDSGEPSSALSRALAISPGARTGNETRLVSALRAMRQCREAENPVDGVSHLFRAIEYIAGSEIMEPVLSPAQLKAIHSRMSGPINEYLAEIGMEKTSTDRITSLLKGQVSHVNDHPLRNKWNAVVSRLEVPYTEVDGALLWGHLRRARNLDIHGESGNVKREDVLRGYAIVERIVLAMLERIPSESDVWVEATRMKI